MVNEQLQIRPLATMNDLTEMQKVESAVWKMNPIPLHHTFTSLQNGGIILGAYDGEDMIGFSYSFPGYEHGQVYLCSHMLGILPGYQHSGIGEQMKLKQAELAREAGFFMMTWTFDPLESRNAYLNLHKLGATGAHYHANYYGDMQDDLNKGLPSDRIKIEWDMQGTKRESVDHVDPEKVLLDRDASYSPVMMQAIDQIDFQHSTVLFAAVPKYFQKMKSENFEQAKAWRMQTRMVFERLFAEGFTATDLVPDQARDVSYYVFTK